MESLSELVRVWAAWRQLCAVCDLCTGLCLQLRFKWSGEVNQGVLSYIPHNVYEVLTLKDATAGREWKQAEQATGMGGGEDGHTCCCDFSTLHRLFHLATSSAVGPADCVNTASAGTDAATYKLIAAQKAASADVPTIYSPPVALNVAGNRYFICTVGSEWLPRRVGSWVKKTPLATRVFRNAGWVAAPACRYPSLQPHYIRDLPHEDHRRSRLVRP